MAGTYPTRELCEFQFEALTDSRVGAFNERVKMAMERIRRLETESQVGRLLR
jgi:hypothetical protein